MHKYLCRPRPPEQFYNHLEDERDDTQKSFGKTDLKTSFKSQV